MFELFAYINLMFLHFHFQTSKNTSNKNTCLWCVLYRFLRKQRQLRDLDRVFFPVHSTTQTGASPGYYSRQFKICNLTKYMHLMVQSL